MRARGGTALSVNVNKVALLRNQRAARHPERRRPVARSRSRRARTASPSIRGPTSATSAAHDVRRARRAAEGLAAGRVQHRGQSVPQPDGRSCASRAPAAVHLRARQRRAGRPPTTAGTCPRRRAAGAADRRGACARRARQPVHGRRCRTRWRAARAIGADRVELYTEPYARAHGTPAQAERRSPRFAAAARGGAARRASASTPATT